MAESPQLLICPLCQTKHDADDGELQPGHYAWRLGEYAVVIPPRLFIRACHGCGVPFYIAQSDGSDSD